MGISMEEIRARVGARRSSGPPATHAALELRLAVAEALVEALVEANGQAEQRMVELEARLERVEGRVRTVYSLSGLPEEEGE